MPTLGHESTLGNVYHRQFSGMSLAESLVHPAGSDGTVVALVVVGEEAPNHRTDVGSHSGISSDGRKRLSRNRGPFPPCRTLPRVCLHTSRSIIVAPLLAGHPGVGWRTAMLEERQRRKARTSCNLLCQDRSRNQNRTRKITNLVVVASVGQTFDDGFRLLQ